MNKYLLAGFGSALGGMARLWVTIWMDTLVGSRLPWGTLLINAAGSLLIGFVAASGMAGGRFAIPVHARVFLMVGICGGFTTFSSFSLQTLELIECGEIPQALFYAAASLVLCISGTWLGITLGR